MVHELSMVSPESKYGVPGINTPELAVTMVGECAFLANRVCRGQDQPLAVTEKAYG